MKIEKMIEAIIEKIDGTYVAIYKDHGGFYAEVGLGFDGEIETPGRYDTALRAIEVLAQKCGVEWL